MSGRIQITGLRELRRELKAADPKFPKEIGRLNKQLVATLFVPSARSKAAARTNPRAGHEVVNSIRGLGSQTRAQIAGGSNRVRWFAGHEFGSDRFKQFPARSPRKGRGNAGYFLYPAVYENMPRALTAYEEMLTKLLAASFPD